MTTATKKLIDVDEVRRMLSVLVEPGQVFELRVLEASIQSLARYSQTFGGYFDNADDAIKHIWDMATIRAKLGHLT